MSNLRYQYFPKSIRIPDHLNDVIHAFEDKITDIESTTNDLPSNDVLKILEVPLKNVGFEVETGKSLEQRIRVPVLYGLNGKTEKSFEADAVNYSTGTVVEVEAGRAVVNFQFLKDLFQACMMPVAKVLVIAVRNQYRGSDDFKSVCTFFETLYINGRLHLPLEGVLIIGY